MDEKTLLPKSKYIDINLGLKYLNANKKLYLKILNSFLTRYQNFDIMKMKEDERQSIMHTLKGLASTLGMVQLSDLAKNLQQKSNKELILEFSKTLTCIISDLKKNQIKILLIIDDNFKDIANILTALEDEYDIMVATTQEEAIESLNIEKIDLVLVNELLVNKKIQNKLEEKKISMITLAKPLDINQLVLILKRNTY